MTYVMSSFVFFYRFYNRYRFVVNNGFMVYNRFVVYYRSVVYNGFMVYYGFFVFNVLSDNFGFFFNSVGDRGFNVMVRNS